MARRPRLDGEHAGDRGGLLGVGAESVHRLGRDDGEPAGCDAGSDTLGVLGDELGGGHREQRTVPHAQWIVRRSRKSGGSRTTAPDRGSVGADVVWIGHADAPSRPRLRPDLRRRVHGPEPVGGRIAPRRRPHHDRRHRDDAPCRRRQHDGGGRPADGRDGGPPRWADGASPGHPPRRRRLRRRLRQESSSALRDGDHADAAPHDRRRPRPHPQAGPRCRCRRRRGRRPARRLQRARRRRLRPLHAAARRRQPRRRHLRRRHRRRHRVRPPHQAAQGTGAGRRRGRPPHRRDHPRRGAALDDLSPGGRRRGPLDARRRRRHQR